MSTTPRQAHFFWMGRELPFMYRVALLSAARNGGFNSVRLHHTDPLDPELGAFFEAFSNAQNAESRGASIEALPCDLDGLLEDVAGPSLVDLNRELNSPVAKSNLFRAAIVLRDGGAYLDMDTVTLRPFNALLASGQAFVGDEYIVFPQRVLTSKNPLRMVGAGIGTAVRDVLRRVPQGHRWWRRIERRYYRAVNGAILGGPPGSPWLRAYVDGMLNVPHERRRRPHALGTHLLQSVTESYGGSDLIVCDPEVFYPLPPEISEHWFRVGGPDRAEQLRDAVSPRTLVAHWYASVRTKAIVPAVNPDYVRRYASRQLFSGLVSSALGWA